MVQETKTVSLKDLINKGVQKKSNNNTQKINIHKEFLEINLIIWKKETIYNELINVLVGENKERLYQYLADIYVNGRKVYNENDLLDIFMIKIILEGIKINSIKNEYYEICNNIVNIEKYLKTLHFL